MTLTRSALPQRSPMPLIVPCTCVAPSRDGGQRVRHRHVAVVVAVDAELDAAARGAPRPTAAAMSSGRVPPLVSHRMMTLAPASCGGLQRLQGVLGVVPEAVEEVLGVVEHLAPGRLAVGDRVGDHVQVLLQRRAEHLA